MSTTQNALVGIGVTQFAVGLSTIFRFRPGDFVQWEQLKYLSGGSLEIVKGASTNGTGWGTGYLLGTTEAVQFLGPATFYLASTGATSIIQVMLGYTSGASLV